MMPLVETALAFVAAMLGASLVVNGAVQTLLTLGHHRSRTVEDMLRSLIHGFRFFYNDLAVIDDPSMKVAKDPVKLSDSAEVFVQDVMTDPTIYARGSATRYGSNAVDVTTFVQYVGQQDLVDLAYNHAEYERAKEADGARELLDADKVTGLLSTTSDDFRTSESLPLPKEWFEGETPKYATAQHFEAYVKRWFVTLDATASQAYKAKARQLTVLVAAFLVVLLNFDSLNLMRSLYQNSDVRRAVTERIPALESAATSVARNEPSTTPRTDDHTAGPSDDIQAGLVTLNSPGLGIGWQDSWIVHRFCAYRGKCGFDAPSISGGRMAVDVCRWIVGLLTSCLFLSLGAPFWYGMLQRLLNLKSEQEKASTGAADTNQSGGEKKKYGPPNDPNPQTSHAS
jgi:hypothetical protein